MFKLDIVLPEMLYSEVLEVDERIAADGTVLCPLDLAVATDSMAAARERGMEAVAIVLVHGYRHTEHEAALAAAAREIGFGQVSISHEIDPLVKIVPRGDTTVADAYLSPILDRSAREVFNYYGGILHGARFRKVRGQQALRAAASVVAG